MCGIAGWIGPETAWNAEAFRDRLRRRGPDGSGIWRSPKATMVHTRLAIQDLSEAGAQPITRTVKQSAPDELWVSSHQTLVASPPQNSPGSCVLVFNGEIYNHHQLREELEAQSGSFTGNSDAEVLLRFLARDGTMCLPRLAGMFAFCFWNEVSGEALLARDAFGIKPLYYRVDGEILAFASEARVLQRADDTMDAEALRDFFLWGSVPEPATLHSEIRQLPAGSLLRWKEGKATIEKWHDAAAEKPKLGSKGWPVDWKGRTRAALLESIQRHLVSDVPVGIFLSGGIDSTVVLALARQLLGRDADIRTFSIGFDNPDFDESATVRRTAEHFGTFHTEWRMTPKDGAAEIPPFLAAMDQPSIDGFNTWCVSSLARREGMKVMLSGLGGDEWFAGYRSFQRVPWFYRLYRWLGPVKPLAAKVFDLMATGSPWRRLAAFLLGSGSWLEAFQTQRGIFTPGEAEQLTMRLIGKTHAIPPFRLAGAILPEDPSPRGVVSHLELTLYMRNQLLRDSDVFSMAHGLELRVPFVDIRLAETLSAIPLEVRLRQGKKLLLEAVPEVPEWVRNQPKRGFIFPFQQWMEGRFRHLMERAQEVSPVRLQTWYRSWAVITAMQSIRFNAYSS